MGGRAFFFEMRFCRIAMVQMNPTVGDLDGNVRAMKGWVKEARRARADVVVFPEMAITGYPPEDLVLRASFLKDTRQALNRLIKACRGITAVIGFIEEGIPTGRGPSTPFIVPSGPHEIFNAAAIVHDARLVSTYSKMILPNYGVFDESRYFRPGTIIPVFVVNGIVMGVNICEDVWYPEGPTRHQTLFGGAELIVNINASPFHMGKSRFREQMLATRARENEVILSYTNMVGGQDELVFDGNSLLLDQRGEIILRAKAFEEDLLVADLNLDAVVRGRSRQPKYLQGRMGMFAKVKQVVISKSHRAKVRRPMMSGGSSPLDSLEEVYRALVVGVRDYVRKNRFHKVLVGLSGGIDSALTVVVATDALGPSNVLGVFMPSPFTSRESREDAVALMNGLGVQLLKIPITGLWKGYLRVLSQIFKETDPDTTEENLQARIRGNILMALSNKFGHLVLTTGNKSEMSVGYATLYGDMAGGFAVIKDVSKTLVYDLARLRNRQSESGEGREVIPKRIIDRAPTAELKPSQTDQDTLPPYGVLDPILEAYVEEDRSLEEILQMGFTYETVKRVVAMVDRSEYKRRQAPIGIKITPRALGKDRRMPITNRYLKV